MSHTAYFEKLLGKTVIKIKHRDVEEHREGLFILFDDGTMLEVWSHVPYSLDSIITSEGDVRPEI